MPDKITKFIQSLNENTKEKLKEKLIKLKENPFKMPGVKKLKGPWKGAYRLRMGDIRIIYKVKGSEIEVIDIDFRSNIY